MHVSNPADTFRGRRLEGSEGESLLVTNGLCFSESCRGPQVGRFLAGEWREEELFHLKLPRVSASLVALVCVPHLERGEFGLFGLTPSLYLWDQLVQGFVSSRG